MSSPEETNAGPVIRDLRRIDPRTGQVRNPETDAPATAGRGPGKPARPGKHSVSKPGGAPGAPEATGPEEPAGAGGPRARAAPRGRGPAAAPRRGPPVRRRASSLPGSPSARLTCSA
jgi:hypothetical protein